MIKKILLSITFCLISLISYSDTYEEITIGNEFLKNKEESPIGFNVTNNNKNYYEIGFYRKKGAIVHLLGISIIHTTKEIKKISEPQEQLFAINVSPDKGKGLSLDFIVRFEKEIPENDFLYLCFQVKESESEIVCYLYPINKTKEGYPIM